MTSSPFEGSNGAFFPCADVARNKLSWNAADTYKGGAVYYADIGFEAARYNSIYGNSNNVQPNAIGLMPQIKL